MEEKLKKYNLGRWWNFATDNGIPVPLWRHGGRGDFVMTVCGSIFVCMMISWLFGGSAYHSSPDPNIGLHVAIPRIQSFSETLMAVLPAIGTLIAYVVKSKGDREGASNGSK